MIEYLGWDSKYTEIVERERLRPVNTMLVTFFAVCWRKEWLTVILCRSPLTSNHFCSCSFDIPDDLLDA